MAGYSAGVLAGAALAGVTTQLITTGRPNGWENAAVSSMLSFGAGEIGAAFGSYGAGHYAAHAVAGCISSSMGGGACGQGALSGLASLAGTEQFQNSKFQFVGAVITGGTASVLGGGSFANGARTAAFGYLYNCGAHPGTCLRDNDKSLSMEVGEALRDGSVRSTIAAFNGNIEDAARAYGVDPDLIRSIIYEEQTHLLPFEATAEAYGVGRTVGLGQVTVGLNGFTRAQLLNPATNIGAIAQHLSNIGGQPLIDPIYPTASLATRYNCGRCTSISNYGRRVDSYYQEGW